MGGVFCRLTIDVDLFVADLETVAGYSDAAFDVVIFFIDWPRDEF